MDKYNQVSLSEFQINRVNELIDKVAKRQILDFGNINAETKDDGSLITNCDRWSDKNIVQGLKEITNGEEGILSEEGSKKVPDSKAFWVVDPLDGTTNFAAGIPHWAISIARFINGEPQSAFLDIPALKQRVTAIKGQGVWINGESISSEKKLQSRTECVSLCSRSINILRKSPNQTFPGKIRLLGVSSLNMLTVATGQTFGAIESTPKIWDIAASWLILTELKCEINWLDINPYDLYPGQDLSTVNFPLITALSKSHLEKLSPWGEILMS